MMRKLGLLALSDDMAAASNDDLANVLDQKHWQRQLRLFMMIVPRRHEFNDSTTTGEIPTRQRKSLG
jgi:hypothetical protein